VCFLELDPEGPAGPGAGYNGMERRRGAEAPPAPAAANGAG
jgi:hypothetical protein